jgi:hypothetical protein
MTTPMARCWETGGDQKAGVVGVHDLSRPEFAAARQSHRGMNARNRPQISSLKQS